LVNIEYLRFGCGAIIETQHIPVNDNAHTPPGGNNSGGGNDSFR
jgi:hypothetical protein